jgi:uncharacterized LabA/DUF88 family protein
MDATLLTNQRLAVLIDAENVPRNCMKSVLEEIAIYGTPTIKRIYGDWTNHRLDGWKTPLLENAITPIQQYSYTIGKNSSDSAMIIDAMDILYTEKTDGFVIVSSDSDFTRLAIRLREAGQRVIGIGERKTPQAFITACDKFTYIDTITKPKAKIGAESCELSDDAHCRNGSDGHISEEITEDVVQLIVDSVADLSEDGEGVFMGVLGNLLRRKKPDFDHRNYDCPTLTALIKSIGRFDIEYRKTSDPSIMHPFVKDKKA